MLWSNRKDQGTQDEIHESHKMLPNDQQAIAVYLTACCFCFFPPQNPREADAMTKVQAELDETKIILVKYLPELRPNTLIKRLKYVDLIHLNRGITKFF